MSYTEALHFSTYPVIEFVDYQQNLLIILAHSYFVANSL